ncbi:MAG: 3-deoxy-D-manno-octulosonic acid transferase [Acidobacteria bacterium]|nr:3-deoxy-D-manno-octulosonic acid transferase [Acidobacteriota bacterium]
MFFLYGIVLTLGLLALAPRFIFSALVGGKYSGSLKQRLGSLPSFDPGGRKVVWLHCVSVGETNAARPLLYRIKQDYPDLSLVVSTTTKTGQKVAREAFKDIAELIFYFPFDWRWTVRRSLRHVKPSIVLLMETEIWFNFIRESFKAHSRVVIVNGRLSERSLNRYTKFKRFMKRVFGYMDLAMMQDKADATRIMALGARASKVRVTGNLKFDHDLNDAETTLTGELRDRFGISREAPLIIASSTHSPEEKWLLDAFKESWKSLDGKLPRLMIAPRHPERFAEVAQLIKATGFQWARRSETPSPRDKAAEVILLDSIGELRSAYPLADIVFVGGSLIPHGGQSIYEPAAAGRAMITGPHTENFKAAVTEFVEKNALIQIPIVSEKDIPHQISTAFTDLLTDNIRRERIGDNALAAMEANRGAVDRTMEYLAPLLEHPERRRQKY